MQNAPLHWYLPVLLDQKRRFVCLDTKRRKGGDCPIVVWDAHDKRGILQTPKRVSVSFTAWLDRLIRECQGRIDPKVLEEVRRKRLETGNARVGARAAKKPTRATRARSGIDGVLDALESHPEVKRHAGASRREIDAASAKLGVEFPAAYGAFLARFGWADVGSDTIYGVGRGVPREASVVANAQWERTKAEPRMRTDLIPIFNDGTGDSECLDLRRASREDSPVVLWSHEHPKGERQSPRRVAASFEAWLKKKLRELPSID